MTKKYQVFISSTYDDLKEERKELIFCLLENKCIPAGMESFTSSSRKQWNIISKEIDESDYVILILAGRYGTMFPNEEGEILSYTEKEFDYAVKNEKPILVFEYKDIEKLPASKVEKKAKYIAGLKKFKMKASFGRQIAYWEDIHDLCRFVTSGITQEILTNPQIGWIRDTDTTMSRES